MSAHTVVVEWERGGSRFDGGRYSRVHRLRFDGGVEVAGSASPAVVPAPWSDARAVDPEEAFVASLAACHMLWFLDLASRAGHRVERYVDRAEGTLAPRPGGGGLWLARVVLEPEVHFDAALAPDEAALAALHHEAHERCFLAAAVRCEMEVRGRMVRVPAAG